MQVKISKKADRDLNGILLRLAKNNPAAAVKLYDEILDKIRALKHNSHVWRRIGNGRQERLVRKTWSVVYRVRAGTVIVLRVWDFRRDPSTK